MLFLLLFFSFFKASLHLLLSLLVIFLVFQMLYVLCFQCSKSCGTGVRTREVKCIDSTFTLSADCVKDEKPSRRQSCSTEPCVVTSDQPTAPSVSESSKVSATSYSYSAESEKDNSSQSSNDSATSTAGQQELQRDDSAQSRKDGDVEKKTASPSNKIANPEGNSVAS